MKNLFAILTLCVASVAMAQLSTVDVVMDITDVENVTITASVDEGTYAGAYFAIDALEFNGAVATKTLTGPMGYKYPDVASFALGITLADGNTHAALTTDTVWMTYGTSYNLGSIVTSSNPADFYAVDGQDTYAGQFIVVDATDNNGLGATKMLGTIVPEPASMSMLALGALALIRRRR